MVTSSCAYFHFARETAGALGARHSPRPLSLGGRVYAQLGRICAAGRRRCVWIAGFHPSPVFVGRVAHRERSDTMCRVGGLSERAHPHMAPTPAAASLWPTLPTKGGGIRKSELWPVFSHHAASNAKRLRTGAKRPGDPRSALSPDERRSVGGIAAPYFAVIASEAKQSIFDLAMACHGLLS